MTINTPNDGSLRQFPFDVTSTMPDQLMGSSSPLTSPATSSGPKKEDQVKRDDCEDQEAP